MLYFLILFCVLVFVFTTNTVVHSFWRVFYEMLFLVLMELKLLTVVAFRCAAMKPSLAAKYVITSILLT